MKRIFIFFSLLASIFALTSCDPAEHMATSFGQWYVKNNTSKALTVSANEGEHIVADHDSVLPGDSIVVFNILKLRYLEGFPSFSELPEYENVHVEVYSENGDLILSWDNNTETGKQSDFFKEEAWRRLHREDFSEIWWVYDINPEDIDASMKK